ILTGRISSPQHREFYKNLTDAINTRLAPASFVDAQQAETNQLWNDLFASGVKLFLVSESDLAALPHLSHLCAQNPAMKAKLYLLKEASNYFADPTLKRGLWTSLTQLLRQD